ncbi:hypothetical protein BURMUCGD1_0517 [Burkholderia multivorans CGD1]|nr:hypothetical protein BURMUCGD1_0517 [Burkholderia multivorans CGD1]
MEVARCGRRGAVGEVRLARCGRPSAASAARSPRARFAGKPTPPKRIPPRC